MRWIRELKLFFRAARRVGAFERNLDAGMSAVQARAYSDAIYPPTPADLEYEMVLHTRKPMLPWGSAIGIFVTILNLVLISRAAYAETGSLPTPQLFLGFAIAQLGWVMLAFGLTVGRFLIFDIESRLKTIAIAIAALIVGTLIVNL